MVAKFQYHTDPYEHQREALRLSASRPYFGLFMEQGTGKTKVTIDTIRFLHNRARVTGVLVVAPGGVHRVWDDEFRAHCEPERYSLMVWRQNRSRTQKWKRRMGELMDEDRLPVLSINAEALRSDNCHRFVRHFLDHKDTIMVVDESTLMKTPGAKRTRRLYALSKRARFRRILSGNPAPEGPFDYFAQLRFLHSSLVGSRFLDFKHQYGVFRQVSYRGGPSFEERVGYKNIPHLQEIIAANSFRVLKSECLDLPPKIYKKRYLELTGSQWAVYRKLAEELQATFPDGSALTVEFKVVLMLRLQQVASGYLPVDDGGGDPQPRELIDSDRNPRLDALMAVLDEGAPGPTIVICRYLFDIDLITRRLEGAWTWRRFDGTVSGDHREETKKAFQAGEVDVMVAQERAIAFGHTLHRATQVVYYTNDWPLELRLQSEDRAHRSGLQHSVTYVDLIAEGTVDQDIVDRLRAKKEMSAELLGDPKDEWI